MLRDRMHMGVAFLGMERVLPTSLGYLPDL